jgi:hypothetical protein
MSNSLDITENMLNPAFCGKNILLVLEEYNKVKKSNGIPYSLLILVLPLLLVKEIRETLPAKSNAKFYEWTKENGVQLINFHKIVQGYMPYTEKALMFLFSLHILKVEENGMINISETNYKKSWDNSIEEFNEVFKKAKCLGKWFGIINSESMIYLHLKIKP